MSCDSQTVSLTEVDIETNFIENPGDTDTLNCPDGYSGVLTIKCELEGVAVVKNGDCSGGIVSYRDVFLISNRFMAVFKLVAHLARISRKCW